MQIPKPEFPRPEKQRSDWKNLNGSWDFRLFGEGHEEEEAVFSGDRTQYDRTIQVPFSWVCPLSQVEEDTAGIGWYRLNVAFEKKERLFLCFGAVDYKADVYINGAHACSHQGGYSYFEVEVTPYWQDGDNVIEVRAEDYRKETQLYGKQGYGEIQGIWQTVWLENRPQAYIKDFRILTKITGQVEISADVDAPDGVELLGDFDGECACGKVQDGKAAFTLNIQNPRLWSPDTPELYEGTLCLNNNGQVDTVHTYFGIREIGTMKVGDREYPWITLNGKPIYLNGALDQAFHPKGHFTYPTDEDMYMEAWRLKRLGLNMVRIHIKPEEPRKLYWMDKLGILVMADIPCFWGPPIQEAQDAYEQEWPEIMARDMNHPSIFSWVVFNESWGLLDNVDGEKAYQPETQEWVRSVYHRAKALDPTRMIEDNSVCRYDHVETDINTWHFYLNSYEVVRDHIRKVVDNTYPGSAFNYIGGNVQNGAPLMNSECGMVWGVDESAGDSDLAWQYHYMLNEYRLHEKICGFIFTEFHDVVNEFNGYYRIDDQDKDFGYQGFCRGMSLKDLHAVDFVATDCPPMQTVNPGELVTVSMVLSSFDDVHHGTQCTLAWELWHEGLEGTVIDDMGTIELATFGYGTTKLNDIALHMPMENAAAVLSLYLKDEAGQVISRNFTTFDVQAPLAKNMVEVPVTAGKADGFQVIWQAQNDEKLCLGGQGQVSYEIELPEIASMPADITLFMEASAKRILKKDRREISDEQQDLGFMRGYRVDRGAFKNSYWMTDESRYPSEVDVLVNGEKIQTLYLENDWSDARGVLSWHYQQNPRKLDEAGSFGEQKRIAIPSRMIPSICKAGKLELTLQVKGDNGLALYGRKSGRYPHGLMLQIK